MKRPPITPGPWNFEIDGTHSAVWPFITAEPQGLDCPIAELGTVKVSGRGNVSYQDNPKAFTETDDHDEVMANARAIAALPDTLAALEKLQTWLTAPDLSPATLAEMEATARAALLKAGYTL